MSAAITQPAKGLTQRLRKRDRTELESDGDVFKHDFVEVLLLSHSADTVGVRLRPSFDSLTELNPTDTSRTYASTVHGWPCSTRVARSRKISAVYDASSRSWRT